MASDSKWKEPLISPCQMDSTTHSGTGRNTILCGVSTRTSKTMEPWKMNSKLTASGLYVVVPI